MSATVDPTPFERTRTTGIQPDMKNVVRGYFLPLACALVCSAFALPEAVDAQQSISLDEALDRALIRSPVIAQQQQSLDNAYLTRKTTWATFLPSLSASGSGSLRSAQTFNDATGVLESGSSDSYGAGISGSWSVFEGTRRFREYDAAKADVRAAEARYADSRFAVGLHF